MTPQLRNPSETIAPVARHLRASRLPLVIAVAGAIGLVGGCSRRSNADAERPLRAATPTQGASPAAAASALSPSAPVELQRLDAPLTPDNSFLVEFASGVVLRVPRALYAPGVPLPPPSSPPIGGKPNTNLSFTFSFPDMTPSGWTSHMDIIFEKSAGRYRPQTDRFPVKVVWMFYTPGEVRNTDDWQGLEPGPRKIRSNLKLDSSEVREFKTPYRGLVQIVRLEGIKKHPPGWQPSPQQNGGVFLDDGNRPYELFMNCHDPRAGVQCVAHAYIKKHGFQYRLIFPPEAVAHTDELILSIEKLLDQWSSK